MAVGEATEVEAMEVSACGYIKRNVEVTRSFITNIVTYFVILLQFKMVH